MKILTISILILMCASSVFSALWDWTTFTNASDIRQLAVNQDTIWCATNGGIVCYDLKTDALIKYTNIDGLSSNDVVAIEKNQAGYLWIALADGHLNIRHPGTKKWDMYQDPSGQIQSINDIFAYGDSVFVASNVGLSLMKMDDRQRWEIPWTAKIGAVKRVLVAADTIWLALEESIKRIPLKHPNPQAPNSWTTYTFYDGLPASEYLSILALQDNIVVGSASGLTIYNGSTWQKIELAGKKILDMAENNGLLLALTDVEVFERSKNGEWVSVGPLVSYGQNIAVVDSQIWLGLKRDGLAHLNSENKQWEYIMPEGPSDNKISSLTFDQDGDLWVTARPTHTAVPPRAGGVFRFDGQKWWTFCRANGFTQSDDYVSVSVDSANRIWAGSWGGGIAIFNKVTEDSVAITEITAEDQKLSGISNDPNYIVVDKIISDSEGNMWLLNYVAANKQVMAVVDYENNQWQYFSTIDQISSDQVSALAIDHSGRKWIGTNDQGITVYNDAATPFDKTDDSIDGSLTSSDGLESQEINDLAMDMDGVMWIGTPEGLHYWYDNNLGIRYNVINDNINTILVDSRNNKWFGTSGGMSMLDADGYTWTHYSTSNSPLVADNVTCFALNEKTGYLYIGTTNGISRLETPYTRPASTLSMLKGYPNPFIMDSDQVRFSIENLTATSDVRIFTAEGVLVRFLPNSQILGSRALWDGRNEQGNHVASGVYVYLVTDERGLSKVGKVAVVRP